MTKQYFSNLFFEDIYLSNFLKKKKERKEKSILNIIYDRRIHFELPPDDDDDNDGGEDVLSLLSFL